MFGEDQSESERATTISHAVRLLVVSTHGQYFLWYTAFLPLIFPMTSLKLRWKGAALIAAWFGSELHWLFWAFHLEMKGENTFFPLWLAGLAFFSVNIGILATLMRHHTFSPLFSTGRIVQLEPNCVTSAASSSKDKRAKTE